ncbi:MAG: MlaD family protein [Smithellaceae bacterium]|nr:MlaD family protein [Smithellaceae bacterium]
MNTISSEAKVGLFVLAGLIILGYMSFKVGQKGFSFEKGYNVQVMFDNVAGLSPDASVQIAGVEVGRVESISLKNGRALVELRINPSVRVERDAQASLKTKGILGEKYIEIKPGTPASGYLRSGDEIGRVERQADIDRLLNQMALIADDIKAVTGSLSSVLGSKQGERSLGDIVENTRELTENMNRVVAENQASLRILIENTRQLTENLNRMVATNDPKINETIDNLRAATAAMEKTFASLQSVSQSLESGEGTMGQLIKDKTMATKLNQAVASLQEVTDKINQGKGTIGKLVNDDETVKNLNEGLAGINRYINKAEEFRTHLSYRGEYLFRSNDAKHVLDVRIQPKEDKFYLLGVVSDPRGKRTVKDYTTGTPPATTTVEEYDRSSLLFNAQIGKRFRNVVFRGGIIESTGGFAVDYLTLNDKLKLSFEAFDFAADHRPHFTGRAEYQILKHLYLTGGWDDFASKEGNSSPFAGFAIRFEDEDLKYLLTSTPIPK